MPIEVPDGASPGPATTSGPDAVRRDADAAAAAAGEEAARRAETAAEARDRAAEERDRVAEERDRAAELEEAKNAPQGGRAVVVSSRPSRAGAERAQAALDRARAAVDRHEARADRDRATAGRRQVDLRPTLGEDAGPPHTRALIARLRGEVDAHDVDLAIMRARLDAAENELLDLRAIRDALTPPGLPTRPGLDLAAAFLPAAERVSGDFYLAAAGPAESTVLVIGDVVGHGLNSARRAAFVRTAFIATAPFSDDPAQLLGWVNTVLVERAGPTSEFITAAALTYRPADRHLRWAYAGHPPALWLDTGKELLAAEHGIPLGIDTDLQCAEGTHRPDPGTGFLLYTDGLTESRRNGELLGLTAVVDSLTALQQPTPAEAVAAMSALATAHTTTPIDDLCLLAARTTR